VVACRIQLRLSLALQLHDFLLADEYCVDTLAPLLDFRLDRSGRLELALGAVKSILLSVNAQLISAV
jgi:hypothetical protein